LRRYRYEKNKEIHDFKLGDAQGTLSEIFKETQASKLGDALEGIPSFFSTIIGMPRFLFVHIIYENS